MFNQPSAFTMGESAPNSGVFESNSLFMGGQDGSDMAIMIHKYDLPELSKYVGGGIFIGGMRAAKDLVEDFKATPKDFKFIFNTCQWGPGVLQKEIEMGRWGVCEVPAELILSQDSRIYNKLWSDVSLSLLHN